MFYPLLLVAVFKNPTHAVTKDMSVIIAACVGCSRDDPGNL